jgi:hypothetical protein
MKSVVIMEGSEMEVEVLMSNFQEVNGYIMPLTVEQFMNGQSLVTIVFDEVKFDEEMDDAVFAK